VLTASGETFVGTNIESVSFGMSLCAERLAIFKAVTVGKLSSPDALQSASLIDAMIAVDPAGTVLAPCGACRQVLLEFGTSAQIMLPSGVHTIRSALVDPFDKGSDAQLAIGRTPGVRGSRTPASFARLFALSDEDRLFLLRLQDTLRSEAAAQYPGTINHETTRSVLFGREHDELVVIPGFFSNPRRPEETTLRIPLRRGISGAAYSSASPAWGYPCASAQGHPGADALPASQQEKVDPGLKWVVAWPLGEFGVITVDGYDSVDQPTMRSIAESPEIQKRVRQMTDLLNG
jgi:cytidine deaminase